MLRRGSVIMIDKGPDFLIGLAAHPEWATSYTWLGDVDEDDMARVVEAGIMRQRLLVQNWGSINATVLATPMRFRLVRLDAPPPPHALGWRRQTAALLRSGSVVVGGCILGAAAAAADSDCTASAGAPAVEDLSTE